MNPEIIYFWKTFEFGIFRIENKLECGDELNL
jgi:hypothetical protein